MPKWRNGRRTRFRVWRPPGCVGSNPTFGTIFHLLIHQSLRSSHCSSHDLLSRLEVSTDSEEVQNLFQCAHKIRGRLVIQKNLIYLEIKEERVRHEYPEKDRYRSYDDNLVCPIPQMRFWRGKTLRDREVSIF